MAPPSSVDDGGIDPVSRKRSLTDYLARASSTDVAAAGKTTVAAAAAADQQPPSKLQRMGHGDARARPEPPQAQDQTTTTAAAAAAAAGENQPGPGSPPLSPLSDMSDGPLSLLTDDVVESGSTPAMPQLVITLDAAPPAGVLTASSGNASVSSGVSATHASGATAAAAAAAAAAATKRKRLTPAEREEKARADAARKREREQMEAARKQEREEQKAAAEAKKKAAAEEKEKKRRQKEEEDRRRADEKERKRREKEDEERRVQEAKEKKERSQLRLNSFFRTGGSTTSNTTSTPAAAAAQPSAAQSGGSPMRAVLRHDAAARGASSSPTKAPARGQDAAGAAVAGGGGGGASAAEVCEYDRIFKPFFVKDNVVMTTTLYGLDDETKEVKARILDEYLAGQRGAFVPRKPFCAASALDYFHVPCDPMQRPLPRGRRRRPPVREIVRMLDEGGGDAEDARTKRALGQLKTVPMKYLFFREDVRPAYFGTVTSQPAEAPLARLARNPLAKTVLPLNYDYDSEAEWVDDGDGEDVDDLDDDDEELNDDDGEMSDFLDDSEDALPLRPAFSGGMEPESTGVCWENARRRAPRPELDAFRMEFILDHDGPLDPFATHYWETPSDAAAAEAASATGTPGKAMAPPPAPADAFAALAAGTGGVGPGSAVPAATKAAKAGTAQGGGSSSSAGAGASGSSTSKTADAKKAAGVAAEFVPEVKKAILQYAKLSKVGIVEMLSVEFLGKCTKSQIKNSLEALAERTGTGQHKTWKLRA